MIRKTNGEQVQNNRILFTSMALLSTDRQPLMHIERFTMEGRR